MPASEDAFPEDMPIIARVNTIVWWDRLNTEGCRTKQERNMICKTDVCGSCIPRNMAKLYMSTCIFHEAGHLASHNFASFDASKLYLEIDTSWISFKVVVVCDDIICEWPHEGQKVLRTYLTHLPWTKWPPFHRRYIKMHFRYWNFRYFYSNVTEVCSKGFIWQLGSIGSDNGLAPNWRQGIIWTNADPIDWCICAALGRNE